jgi:hypothetical protein
MTADSRVWRVEQNATSSSTCSGNSDLCSLCLEVPQIALLALALTGALSLPGAVLCNCIRNCICRKVIVNPRVTCDMHR